MIKRTLFFENPGYFHIKNRQLICNMKSGAQNSVPLEDIGFIVFDNQQITFSYSVIEELIERNVAIIFCDKHHLPSGVLLNYNGNSSQTEILSCQVSATQPLKKRLWKQTVESKIKNQISLLKKNKDSVKPELKDYLNCIKSGDSTNREAMAAKIYWKELFD